MNSIIENQKKANKIMQKIIFTKKLKHTLFFTYEGKDYAFTGYGVLARVTRREDGKNWYSYGSFGDNVSRATVEIILEQCTESRVYNHSRSEYFHTYKKEISHFVPVVEGIL